MVGCIDDLGERLDARWFDAMYLFGDLLDIKIVQPRSAHDNTIEARRSTGYIQTAAVHEN